MDERGERAALDYDRLLRDDQALAQELGRTKRKRRVAPSPGPVGPGGRSPDPS